MHSIIKSTFYIAFIIISLVSGITMLTNSRGDKKIKVFGLMVLFLVIGEGFHLIPRIIEIFSDGSVNIELYIENGRFIASLSIVLVYLLLFWFWKLYNQVSSSKKIDVMLIVLGIFAFVLSLVLKNSENIFYIFLRNLPTLLIGSILVINFRKQLSNSSVQPFKHLWLAVLLAILFTIGFELLSSSYSFFIILMMPKTLVYIWIVLMGYFTYKKEMLSTQN